MILLFAAHVRARRQCWCGSSEIHRRCANLAFERFLGDLERAAR